MPKATFSFSGFATILWYSWVFSMSLISCKFSFFFFPFNNDVFLFIYLFLIFPALAPRSSPNLVAKSMGCFLANVLLAFLFCDCVHCVPANILRPCGGNKSLFSVAIMFLCNPFPSAELRMTLSERGSLLFL